MLGAIVGDVIGASYELEGIKTVSFELFPKLACFTDDTVCTLAIADAFMKLVRYPDQAQQKVAMGLMSLCRQYPEAGYGLHFSKWLHAGSLEPYGSFGNGAAMRVSPTVALARDVDDVLSLAKLSAEITHNHPEGMKGAQAVAVAMKAASLGASKEDILTEISARFAYDLSRSVDEIRAQAEFNETCQVSVPEAITCFLDARDFESSVRNAVSLGADADTQAAIAGSISECFYGGVPESIASKALATLTPQLKDIFDAWVQFIDDPLSVDLARTALLRDVTTRD